MALQRLASESEMMPHLSARDRALCACIVRERQQTYVGGPAQQTYTLDPDCALLAAVGHPLVLADPGDETPLELVPAGPTLRVIDRSKDILVQIEPFPQEGRSVQPVQEGGQRIRLVQFDDSHRQIGAILGPDGLAVPKASQQALLKTLSSLAPLLTVHSDIGGGDSGAATEVPADARPHLHLTPSGQGLELGLQLELFVHPFGDAGPQLRPGEGSATLLTEIDGRALRCTRDLRAERHAVQQLLAACRIALHLHWVRIRCFPDGIDPAHRTPHGSPTQPHMVAGRCPIIMLMSAAPIRPAHRCGLAAPTRPSRPDHARRQTPA